MRQHTFLFADTKRVFSLGFFLVLFCSFNFSLAQSDAGLLADNEGDPPTGFRYNLHAQDHLMEMARPAFLGGSSFSEPESIGESPLKVMANIWNQGCPSKASGSDNPDNLTYYVDLADNCSNEVFYADSMNNPPIEFVGGVDSVIIVYSGATTFRDTVMNSSSAAADSVLGSPGVMNVGINTVTLTGYKGNGPSTEVCTFTVTVVDTTFPVIVGCPADVTVNADADGCTGTTTPTTWSDPTYAGCEPTITQVLGPDGTATVTGVASGTLVRYIAVSSGGKEDTCDFNVIVDETTPPVIINCPSSVTLDMASGKCDTAHSWTVPIATDNCDDDFPPTQTAGDDPGTSLGTVGSPHTITYEATDFAGNVATPCTFTITINPDNQNPVAICADPMPSVTLDASGNGTFAALAAGDGSSTDNCGDSESSPAVPVTCTDVGTNTGSVLLTATDAAGNTDTETCSFTVIDNTPPVAVCASITNVALDINGDATLAADVAAGASTDACGVTSATSPAITLICDSVGSRVVVLTVTDANGNTSTADCGYTVVDEIDPGAVCATITNVALDGNGDATLAADVAAGASTDACGVTSATSPAITLICDSVGSRIVVLTVTDVNGNTSTADCGYTVVDEIDPVAACATITNIALDVNGDATLAADVAAGASTDGCGIASATSPGITLICDSVGSRIVVLTVTDASGNTSTADCGYTVVDEIDPVAACATITNVALDVNGDATLAADVAAGASTDACGVASATSPAITLICDSVGSRVVVLTVTDVNGNTSTADCGYTVVDEIDPVAVCAGIANVSLNVGGNATLPDNAAAGASTDACGIASATSPEITLICDSVGSRIVVLTVTDANGNTSTADCGYTVVDEIAPVAVCATITNVALDVNGDATLAADVAAGASTDACGVASATSPAITLICDSVGSRIVVLTVTDANGNTSTADCGYTVVDETDPVAACATITNIALDVNGDATLAADAAAGASTDACGVTSATSPLVNLICDSVGSRIVVLTVTDVNGNTSTADCGYTVVDEIDPVAVCATITNVALDVNGDATLAADAAAGASTDACGVTSATSPSITLICDSVGSRIVVLTVTDANGNTSTADCGYTVVDDIDPVAVCETITNIALDVNGDATLAADAAAGASTDACGVTSATSPAITLICDSVGSRNVVLTVTDANGNTSTADCGYTVVDETDPVAACATITNVSLDVNGDATLAADAAEGASTDACGVASATSPEITLICDSVGSRIVVLTVTDANGNTSTADCGYTVVDETDPVAVCATITNVALDVNGDATLAADVAAGASTDACGVTSATSPAITLICDSVGSRIVVLTVTDVNGNTSTADCGYTVVDETDPVAVCATITNVALDVNGDATLAADVAAGASTDACGVTSATSPAITLICDSVGSRIVVLTVTDANGNTSTADCGYTVVDETDPVAVCATITNVALDVNGDATLAADVAAGASTDACGVTSATSPAITLICDSVGSRIVVLTVTDVNGNTSTADCGYTVVDETDPVAVCATITNVALDVNGDATLAADAAAGASTDACGVTSATSPAITLICDSVGSRNVVLTVTDANGNTSTADCGYTVVDDTDPAAVCATITNVSLDVNGDATLAADAAEGASTDACGVTSATSPAITLICDSVGSRIVVLTVTDANGNTSTADCGYTVVDDTDPAAVCATITNVSLDASGDATLAADAAEGASTDACGVASATSPAITLICDSVGSRIVVLTVTDANGNTSTADCGYTVVDEIDPIAMCAAIPDITLDINGEGVISANLAAGASTDICGISSATHPQIDLDCADVGPQTLTLTVTDNGGNVSTASCPYTVIGNTSPTAICGAIDDVELDASGNGVLAEDAANASASSNCGVASATNDQVLHDCNDVGVASVVVLTVTDVNANIATINCNYNVVDILDPTPVCATIPNVVLSGSGSGVLTADAAAGTSSDNCGIDTETSPLLNLTCADAGPQTVTLTVTDVNNNTATTSCPFFVDVNVSNAALCAPVVDVELNSSGVGILPADVANAVSTSNCGIASATSSQVVYNCTQVGAKTVVLTVTDVNSNVSTVTCNYSVVDNIDPTPVCAIISDIVLNGSGNGTLAANAAAGTSTDNCSVFNATSPQRALTCADAGSQTVVLTVTDVNNNTATTSCPFFVDVNVTDAALCAPVVDVELNVSGVGVLPTDVANAASSSNCGIASATSSQVVYNCTEVGAKSVVLTVTDLNSNVSTVTCNYSVVDIIDPTPVCATISDIVLNGSGNGTLAANAAAGASTDNCSVFSATSPQLSLDCADAGPQTVVLTVTDVNSNTATASCPFFVDVNVSDAALCAPVVDIELNTSGVGILPADVANAASTSNCGIASATSSQVVYNCSQVGAKNVVLTVTDLNSNVSTVTCNYSVVDNIDPTPVCATISPIVLNGSGNGTLAANAAAGASTDNCSVFSATSSQLALTCADAGPQTVVLTVTDVNNNTATTTCNYFVDVNVSDAALCAPVSNVELNGSGLGSLPANVANAASTSNCGIASATNAQVDYNCSQVGAKTVVLTVTDVNSNVSTANCNYSVVDNINPVPVCATISDIVLDGSGNGTLAANAAAGASVDNCSVFSATSPQRALTCADAGPQSVVLTVTDVNGNSTSTSCNYFVDVNVSDLTLCAPVSDVQINGSGLGSLPANVANAASSSNCGIASATNSQVNFSCSDVGAKTVVLTVTDVNNNTSTATCNYNVIDIIPPAPVCATIPDRVIDGSGNASLPVNIAAGSSVDNCTILSSTSPQRAFTCADAGPQSVLLTVTDVNGNSSTTTCNYFVDVNVSDVALCAPVMDVEINGSGFGSLPANVANIASSSNCGIASATNAQIDFTCSDVGPQSVVLSVTDVNNNTSTATCNYDVIDIMKPSPVCATIPDVVLNGSGSGLLSANVAAGSSVDNCTILSATSPQQSLTCAEAGPQSVVLTVTDVNGNSSTASCNYFVDVNVSNAALCAPVTNVVLNASGTGQLPLNVANASASSNCGIAFATNPIVNHTCADIGNHSTTLTITDVNANTSFVTCSYSVEDVTPPVPVCKSIADIELDINGNGTLLANAAVGGSSTDACGVSTESSASASLTCANLGPNSVTLSVSDVNGNSTTTNCNYTVVDKIDPTLFCQGGFSEILDAGGCTASPTWTTPLAVDNCDSSPIVTQTNGSASGTPLSPGNHTISYSATDASSNVSSCSFVISVGLDTEDPEIICPNDTLVELDSGSPLSTYSWADAIATDNCDLAPVVTQTSGPASGSGLGTGIYNIVFTATDIAGNTAACTFILEIEGDNEPPIIDCPGNIITDLEGGVCYTHHFWLDATAIDNDDPNPIVTQIGGPLSGDTLYTGTYMITYEAVDADGNAADCYFTVDVNGDEEVPDMLCPGNIVTNFDPGSCSSSPTWIAPLATDNCDPNPLVFQAAGFPNGTALGAGSYTYGYEAIDVSGNIRICTFTITVNPDNIPPVLNCPANIVVDLDSISCTAAPVWSDPIAVDNCDNSPTVTQVAGGASGTPLTPGVYQVTYRASDFTNNTIDCSFLLVINNDNAPPTAVCGSIPDVELDTLGVASLFANVAEGGSYDNCGVNNTLSAPKNHDCFDLGVQSVQLTVTDFHGNIGTTTCSYEVVDRIDPEFDNCPSVVTVYNSSGQCSGIANWAIPSASDNCSVSVTQTAGPALGSTLLNGAVVSYIAIDGSGNAANCSFNVEVLDIEPPFIACPPHIYAVADPFTGGAVVNYPIIYGMDNCDGIVPAILVVGMPANSFFPVGTTSNIYQSTDVSDNSSACSFSVIVSDSLLCPVITNTDVTMNSLTSATLNWQGNSPTYQLAYKYIGEALYSTRYSNTNSFTINDLLPGKTYIWKVRDQCLAPIHPSSVHGFTALDTFETGTPCVPSISCPGDVSVNATEDYCSAIVDYTAPFGDGCGTTIINFVSGQGNGGAFPVGETIETYNLIDGSGNAISCSFSVTVSDNQAPDIFCPPNVTVDMSGPNANNTIVYIAPQGVDNCDATTVAVQTNGLPSGSAFPSGTTINTYETTDQNGNVSSCSFSVVIIDEVVVCVKPTNLRVENLTELTATLRWDAPGLPPVQVAWRPVGGTFTTENLAGTDFYEVTGLNPSTDYEWKVRDRCGPNGSSTNGWTSLDGFLTAGEPCTEITGTFETNVTATTATLNWVAPGLDIAQVAYKRPADPKYSTQMSFSGNNTTVSGLIPNSMYIWKVRDKCDYPAPKSSIHGFTQLDTFYTFQGIPCEAPTFLSTSNVTGSSVTFSWVSPSTSFQIAFRPITNPITSWTTANLSGTNSYTATNLLEGMEYEWKVKDLCGLSGSEYGWQQGPSVVTSQNTICSQPDNLTANNITPTSARLGWTTTTSNPSFQVAVKRIDVFGATWRTHNVLHNSYETFELEPGAAYKWKAKDLCIGPNTGSVYGWSYEHFFNTPNGMENPTQAQSGGDLLNMELYPNPARDILNIRIHGQEEKDYTLTIYDIVGKKIRTLSFVQELGVNEQELNISELSPAIYFLRYYDGERIKNFKFEKR